MMTGFTALNALWLVSAFTFTRQDMVALRVSPQVTVEPGHRAFLQCNVSSKLPDLLQVQYMEWSRNKTTLCSVNSEGNVTVNTQLALSDVHCGYNNHQLLLTFNGVQPMDSGRYGCKLQSNQGALHRYSGLDLEEQSEAPEGYVTSRGPGCRFRRVHPDGEVLWFHGSHRLSRDAVKHHTTKRVEDGGWLTIDSQLKRDASKVPYNCSLKSTRSGRFIASALVYYTDALPRGTGGHRISPGASLLRNSGVTATGTVLYVSILLLLTLK